jgi:hypothetical protein
LEISTELGLRWFSLQDASFAVAGHPDSRISVFSTELIRPLHESFTFDETFVPAFAYPLLDHRQRKVRTELFLSCFTLPIQFQVQLNAYAFDFWRHQSKRVLEHDNNINERETWQLVHDFAVRLFLLVSIFQY